METMDDNTKVMLKLATLLAQQNNARTNNTSGQNPLTELATQLLMNSANETLAIPTSMQCSSTKQQQQDNHNSNIYATQVMTNSQSMDTSNHIGDSYNTSHNQRLSSEVNIKPVNNRTTEVISINTSVAKDIITLTPPVNRDSYGIASSAIVNRESFSPANRENFSVHSPVLKDNYNGTASNTLLNTSTMNRDMFTSSGCRDSYTTSASTMNRGNAFPVTPSANRDSYSVSSVVNNAQQPLIPTVNRDSFTASAPINRETYCNSVLSRDNFNLSRDVNNAISSVTRDSFSTNCSVTRDSFTDNTSIIRDSFAITSPVNRETYTGTSIINRETYPTTSVNRGSFSSVSTEEQESFTMNSPNRVQEENSINTVNMMRNDIPNNASINRVQEEMGINRVDDVVSSISDINTPMCSMSSINPPPSEMPVNSNNCAYYKRPIQGEKGRSYPQPVILRSRPRPAKERSKRGPKEKDYFRTAFFCLPSVTARLPRFTSADPREQELVYEYQKKGYGKSLMFIMLKIIC